MISKVLATMKTAVITAAVTLYSIPFIGVVAYQFFDINIATYFYGVL